MSANYDIDPIHLRTYELNYELRIRKVVTDRVDISLKRKYLRRELKKDLARPHVHVYVTPNFDFELEQREISDSIRSITDLINDYDGSNVELGNRIRSRINHVLGRIGRIPDDVNDDASNFRGDNIIIVSALEEDLAEAIARYTVGEGTSRGAGAIGGNVVSKSIPVYKWPVKFNGRVDKSSLNSFLQRVEELRLARKCSKEELFEAASDLFEDYSLEWFRAQLRHNRFNSWDSLVNALRQDFLPTDYDSELWKQIERRTQHTNEPVVIYISIMENLFECLSEKPTEKRKLRTLMSQVLPEYQSHLALQDIPDVSSLVVVCRALEDSERIKKAFRPPPNKNICTLEPGLASSSSEQVLSNTAACCHNVHAAVCSHNEMIGSGTRASEFRSEVSNVNTARKTYPRKKSGINQVSEVRCWKCNGIGHIKRNCRKSQRTPTCFGCGKKGVIRPNCSNCHPKNQHTENEK